MLSDASPVFTRPRNLATPAEARGTDPGPQLPARRPVYGDVGMGRQGTTAMPGGGRLAVGALLLAGLLCAAVGLSPTGTQAKKRHAPKQKKPNIVLIMDDDQSVNLQQYLTKTNADIAAHGVTFDNSFVNYS